MPVLQPLSDFFTAIANDPRISITHIGIYAALLDYWGEHGCENPISVFSYQITVLAKIDADTYHKRIRELHEYGYIRYEPSFKRNRGSRIFFITGSISTPNLLEAR